MSMFCYQCQETIQNTGCTVAGACGKKADIANLQDELVRQLKILALQYECKSEGINEAGLLTMQSLFMTITNANFDGEKIQSQIDKVKALQSCGSCCCAAKPELPAGVLATENEDLRSLRELLIYGLKGIAAYADHAAVLGKENPDIYAFAFKALAATTKDLSVDELVGLVLECGKVAVDTMALLDGANTGTFGNPEITSVKLGVGN